MCRCPYVCAVCTITFFFSLNGCSSFISSVFNRKDIKISPCREGQPRINMKDLRILHYILLNSILSWITVMPTSLRIPKWSVSKSLVDLIRIDLPCEGQSGPKMLKMWSVPGQRQKNGARGSGISASIISPVSRDVLISLKCPCSKFQCYKLYGLCQMIMSSLCLDLTFRCDLPWNWIMC